MSKRLTLMAVHAHPDDESSSTGGILSRYSDEGVQTIVVTCTNGELGDGPGGVKPGIEGHDEQAVAATRLDELQRACTVLGVAHVELLGYHDSGMSDWDYQGLPDAFSNAPFDEAVDRVVALFEHYRPDVVVTYDDTETYDHPDHVQANRVTMAAVERSAIPKKAYFTAMRRSDFEHFRRTLEEQGIDLPDFPEPDAEWIERMDAVEARITTTVDVNPFVERKRIALGTHASQIEESFFSRLPPEAFAMIFARESFIRAYDTTDAPTPEDDLFAGLR